MKTNDATPYIYLASITLLLIHDIRPAKGERQFFADCQVTEGGGRPVVLVKFVDV